MELYLFTEFVLYKGKTHGNKRINEVLTTEKYKSRENRYLDSCKFLRK